MHITSETDYAVRIVHCLAEQNKRLDAKFISEHTGVSLRFALKILRKLVADGVITSYKGAKGGYELAKPPQDISIANVIEIVEGKYYLSRCLNDNDYQCTRNESCGGKGMCKFKSIYGEISRTVQDKLEAVKFSDLL